MVELIADNVSESMVDSGWFWFTTGADQWLASG